MQGDAAGGLCNVLKQGRGLRRLGWLGWLGWAGWAGWAGWGRNIQYTWITFPLLNLIVASWGGAGKVILLKQKSLEYDDIFPSIYS